MYIFSAYFLFYSSQNLLPQFTLRLLISLSGRFSQAILNIHSKASRGEQLAFRQQFQVKPYCLIEQFGDRKDERLLGVRVANNSIAYSIIQLRWSDQLLLERRQLPHRYPRLVPNLGPAIFCFFICISFHVDLEVQANSVVVFSCFFLYSSCVLSFTISHSLELPFIKVMLLLCALQSLYHVSKCIKWIQLHKCFESTVLLFNSEPSKMRSAFYKSLAVQTRSQESEQEEIALPLLSQHQLLSLSFSLNSFKHLFLYKMSFQIILKWIILGKACMLQCMFFLNIWTNPQSEIVIWFDRRIIMIVIIIMITIIIEVSCLIPLYAKSQCLAMKGFSERSKFDQLIQILLMMYNSIIEKSKIKFLKYNPRKIDQLLCEICLQSKSKDLLKNQCILDLLFQQQSQYLFFQHFYCIFESKRAQEQQNTATSHKRDEKCKLILLINANAINEGILFATIILIKQHIFMDSPNPKDFNWLNASTLLSNCTQIFPLDKMLTFFFQYKGKISFNNIDNATEFFKYNELFQNQITQYLIQMIEKVCSVTFNVLANKKCNENQAKCYAAKNMLENIKYLCLEVSRIIKESNQRNIKQKGKRTEEIEKLTRDITQFICEQIKVYIEQIFPKYPSTPLSGYSEKLKNAIRLIDRRQDYTNDFLHIHKLQIGDAKNTQELISQIMVFLNKVKAAPYENIEGKKDENDQQETYEECFQKFNRNLVWIISQKDITQKMISAKDKEDALKVFSYNLQNKPLGLRNSSLFQFLVSPSQNNLLKIMKQFKGFQRYTKDWELVQKYQSDLKQYQREHKFAANAKISMDTQQFQKGEINNAELRFKSSALLRVVVKWVKDLQDTLKESKKYIRDNGFKFKIKKQVQKQEKKQSQKQISSNEDLTSLSQQKRRILQSAIKKAESQNKNKQSSNKINMFLVDSLMDQEQQVPHYNFQNSLKLSSQVNAYIGKETVQKLIKLISIFDSIPQHLEQSTVQYLKNKNKNSSYSLEKDMRELKPKLLQQLNRVNLVSNRIGDLLRSKIVCTEPQIIKLLNLLYQLDKYCSKQINSHSSAKDKEKLPFFKIIRIKNKLKDTTNNVHINYMLYGKIQCELQICFLNNKKVQNANQTMHHFLYELKRGIYGVVPQLANIVNQNDPICQHNQSSNLNFIKYSQKAFKHKQFEERTISQSERNKYILRCIYKDCSQFSLQNSKRFITKDEKNHRSQCLKCFVQKNESQKNVFDALKQLQKSFQDQWMQKILEERTELQIQEITENQQDAPGVYLVIYPTQKRIIVKLYIIFKHYKTGKLIIKCLQQNSQKDQRSQKALEFKTQKVYKEHKSMKKLYFKVNRFKLRRLFQKKNNDNSHKKDRVQFYINNLSKKQIRSLKLKAVKQFDRVLLDKQIQNKQQHLRLGQMQSITNELQEYFQKKSQLTFVQRVYAQSIQLQKLLPIGKFHNLKELHLKRNQLRGLLTIQNHLSLTYIDLSYNRINQINLNDLKNIKNINLSDNQITKIKLNDLKNLKDINLSDNQITKIKLNDLKALINLNLNRNYGLNQFDFIGLTSLQNLSMLGCRLQGQVVFREQLQPLQILNVQSNQITKLDLRNCPSLRDLNCKYNPPIQLIFNKKTSLQSMEAYNLKSLPQFSLDQLQKIDVCLSADQITQLCFSQLRGDKYLSKQSIFDHIKHNKKQLQKLKNIKIILEKSSKQSIKVKQWQQNADGQLLQQFIANLSNLTSLRLIDCQSAVLIQHLDLSRVQQQIQDIYIGSKTLKSLKLNKVKRITIRLQNLDQLQILTPQSLKQFTVYGINKSIQSYLSETAFFQKCANMQSIRMDGNEQPSGVYEFTNLKHLKQIYIQRFSASKMICRDNAQQQPISQTLGNKPQKLTLFHNKVKGCTIELSQLTELKIYHYNIINGLKIKFPLKSIKKIQIQHRKIQNLQASYYDENEKADLQYFYDYGNSLALLKMLNTKVNSIKHLKLSDSNWERKEQLRLSSICTNIEQLTVEGHWNKLIVDTSIKAINIQGTIAEFIFDNIVSANNKRQKLTLTLSRQCLLKTKFINSTNQVIDVAIKAKGFKSVKTFKNKNKEQKIRFTFISEQQDYLRSDQQGYLRSEQRDISQEQQNLLKQLKLSRGMLDEVDTEEVLERFLKIAEEEAYQQRIRGGTQDYQQNGLTQLLLLSPRYQQLSKSYNQQLKEKQERQQEILLYFYQGTVQFKQYEQLLNKSYKILQEDRVNEFQEDQLTERKKTQLNQKLKLRLNKRLDRDSKQLLKRYCRKVQQDLANMSEDERKELQKGVVSSQH